MPEKQEKNLRKNGKSTENVFLTKSNFFIDHNFQKKD